MLQLNDGRYIVWLRPRKKKKEKNRKKKKERKQHTGTQSYIYS